MYEIQSIQAFVTGFGPFRNRSCKLVHMTIEYQVVQYVPSIGISQQFGSILVTNSPNRFHFFFYEVVVVDAWSGYFVELLRRLVG